jgi:ABC-2 type transport system ATP-binding protein
MIHIEALCKRFGNFDAVKDLSLHVDRGEVFGFLGPNGAGKTTTMKIMVGLMRPTSGRVHIGGVDVQKEPILAKQMIGYIPDRPFLYEKLSGEEFMLFTAGLYAMDRKSVGQRVGELLQLFDLQPWANELVESYSHGMKQRLTMAAALLHQPQVVVVDEPMVGLDPKGAVLVKSIFKTICASGQGTVFLSTHTLEVAEELCDRVAILQRGQIVAQGTMEEIRNQVGDDGRGHLQELFLRLTGGADVTEAMRKFRV